MSSIHIKKSHEGRFTKFCSNKGYDSVTNECIEEGLASKAASTRKQAQFALNAKSFNH
jgi:hypothetical protein